MIYKPFQDLNISQLGMGNMRLPTNEAGTIDQARAREIIEYAYDHGVNYFDTAFRYHNGESETFVGSVLKQYPRDSFLLASKLPGHMMSYENGKLGFKGYLSNFHVDSIAEIFEEQLQKCQVEYFDFYLLHNVCETSFDFYTNEELGVVRYLLEQKKAGRIRHLGFSSHGRPETIEKFIETYDCFEFCQIQLNYLDATLQEAKKKYDILTAHNIPVIVMEPVRGGKLADLGEAHNAQLKAARPDDSVASWAFRYLQGLPNVQIVLSGMTTLEQLQDNLKTFASPAPLSGAEQAILDSIVGDLLELVPCTACRYCCEECPQGLNIPKLIALYNEMKNGSNAVNFVQNGSEDENPSRCIGCGACVNICPQGIQVPEIMEKLAEMLARN